MTFLQLIQWDFRKRVSCFGYLRACFTYILQIIPPAVFFHINGLQQWLKLLKTLNLDLSSLDEESKLNITSQSSAILHFNSRTSGCLPYSSNANRVHVLVDNDIILFPWEHAALYFISEPIIISLSNSLHPFATIHDFQVWKGIQSISFQENQTTILLTDHNYNTPVVITIGKILDLPESANQFIERSDGK